MTIQRKEVIAKPLGARAECPHFSRFRGSDARVPGKAGSFSITSRALILSALSAIALIIYCVAGYYSSDLIQHVVEQSLIQKAPPGVDPPVVRQRLEALLQTEPDEKARVQRLLKISEYLEKIQSLTLEEWESLF